MAPEDFFEFVPEIGMCRGGLAVLECKIPTVFRVWEFSCWGQLNYNQGLEREKK